jgi:hypothetical protein
LFMLQSNSGNFPGIFGDFQSIFRGSI